MKLDFISSISISSESDSENTCLIRGSQVRKDIFQTERGVFVILEILLYLILFNFCMFSSAKFTSLLNPSFALFLQSNSYSIIYFKMLFSSSILLSPTSFKLKVFSTSSTKNTSFFSNIRRTNISKYPLIHE